MGRSGSDFDSQRTEELSRVDDVPCRKTEKVDRVGNGSYRPSETFGHRRRVMEGAISESRENLRCRAAEGLVSIGDVY